MTTLIERLRVRNMMLCDEAADELEQLQTSLDQQREYHAAELADVIAERDHAVEQAARNADEVLRLREQITESALQVLAHSTQAHDAYQDAERYRKWRADYTGTEHSEMLIALADAWEPAQVDAAIDAARSTPTTKD